MARVIVQRSCAKLRSAIAVVGDKFTGELKEMLRVMDGIQPLLEGAERQSVPNSTAWYWLRRVRKTAYDIFDMVDELQAESTPPAAATIKMQIKAIKKELEEVRLESAIFKHPRDTRVRRVIHVEEATAEDGATTTTVARDAEKQLVMSALSASGITQGAPIILPILGPPRIGKTTLARMVFNDNQFEECTRAWVDVSQEFDLCKIGKSITSHISTSCEEDITSDDDMACITKRLQHELLNNGSNKDLLVVLDDLWEEDSTQLKGLKHMLTVGDKAGSKVTVIVTTCDQGIAKKICTVERPYKINPLSQEMCWAIIKQKSCFQDRHRSEKQELEQIGREIASKCDGVPSTAQVLGATLRLRDSVAGWMEVMRQQGGTMYSSPAALELSYRRMPPNLKLCFAYVAIFPKGHTIVKHDLVHQWIALHLIESSENVTPTQRAEEYITKLLDISFLEAMSASEKDDEASLVRPLIQSSEKHDKGGTLFTMPDKVHDFAVSVMGAELIVCDATLGTSGGNEYCRYALLTDLAVRRLNLSSMPAQLRTLRFVGCSKMQLDDDSFAFARCLRVLELKKSSMQKLPDSICLLRHLGYLNLSGCSWLVTLPELFGNLKNLFHINLSGCCRLVKLPESFGMLERLEHLDISFSSCFQGIQAVVSGLINLQHLNLSNPCCYLPEHRSYLQGLKHVLCKLTKLVHLNLSMFLNPIFCYMLEEERREYIESCISGLSNLEHLDLSHNIFLSDLPENIGDLTKLHTLDLSSCIRLFPVLSVIKRACLLNSLKLLVVWKCRSLFVVRDDDGAHNGSNLVQLEDANCTEMEIICLEKVKSAEEARRIRLADKGKLQMLNIHWTVGCHGCVEDSKDLLAELVPPHNLQCLELHGYNGTCFPSWTLSISSHLPNLVKVTMEDIPMCSRLPPFGLLPKLKYLVLRRMARITRINAADLSGGDTAAFHRLTKFTIDDMESLQEFNTTYDNGDEEEYLNMLPTIDELVIRRCPKLSFGPFLPRARRLLISDCDQVMASTLVEGPSTPVTELVVESCRVSVDNDWSLLCHLDGLQTLCFSHCHNMTTLPQDLGDLRSLQKLKIVSCKHLKKMPVSMQRLTSLQSMHFCDCESIEALPEWFERLTSLKMLAIDGCHAIQSLPESIQEITNLKLHILDCPKLEEWRQSKEKDEKLANMRLKQEYSTHVSVGCCGRFCYKGHNTKGDGSPDLSPHVRDRKRYVRGPASSTKT